MLKNLLSKLRLNNVTLSLVAHQLHVVARRLSRSRPEQQVILAIVGCQRSGTSVMSRMFFRDYDCVVYREKSALTGGVDGLRYKPFPDVSQRVARKHASLIVFKMLVESQRVLEFLDTISNAKAIWLFRHYRDVASSNLIKFGIQNAIDDIRPYLRPDHENWRSEKCSEETTAIIRRLFSEEMNPNDAAALFWYCRNRLFFENGLDNNSRVMPIQYESFVNSPTQTAQDIYEFVDLPFPGDRTTREISAISVRKGEQLSISSEVQDMCDALLADLRKSTL